MIGRVEQIPSSVATEFLLPRHYSGRKPQICVAFGWIVNNRLEAVCTFGKPATPHLCENILGGGYKDSVYELNRLCRNEDFKEPLSCFVGACLRRLRVNNWIIVSYSDTAMHHNGYIYQATNFMFTGTTHERTDVYTGESKHSRHYTKEDMDCGLRKVRSPKNRYVFFATRDKRLKKKWLEELKFPILPYPKAENQNYTLGEYIQETIIDTHTGERHLADKRVAQETSVQTSMLFDVI